VRPIKEQRPRDGGRRIFSIERANMGGGFKRMVKTAMNSSTPTRRRAKHSFIVMGILAAMIAVAGCEVDSFFDPSVVGRWERSPVVMPILDQLDMIDEQPAQAPGTTQVEPQDLIERVHEYVIGSGDLVTFSIFELIAPGVETVQTRRVDELGIVRLPVLGPLKVRGNTPSQVERQIKQLLEDMDVLKDAEVAVIVQEGRQNTYSVIGEPREGSTAIGTYTIPHPNFRLLEAMALARGAPGRTKTVYVIRDANFVQPRMGQNPTIRVPDDYGPTRSDNDVTSSNSTMNLIDTLTAGMDDQQTFARNTQTAAGSGLNGSNQQQWIFRDNQWVKVDPMLIADTHVFDVDEVGMLQPIRSRIVEIPYSRLLDGDMRYNVVIRPGDVVRVPAPVIGNVYIMGAISRPGTYALPGDKDLTLKQLVAAAGNLSTFAIPNRVDLVRRVRDNQEATVRLNLRAIFDGTQPDFYLKPNDLINIGTSFFAPPLAIARNGFRMTYGFGFVLDRNFEDDVFGNFSN
jgi:protein involved in polysaccharide export with SLBB domain